MVEYAVRVDVCKSESHTVAKKINTYLNADSHLWVFEISKKVGKEHIHGYVKTSKVHKMETIGKWMRRQSFYSGKGSVSCVLVKDASSYKDYICKDMNIILTNFKDEEVEQLIETAMSIKEDKSSSIAQKLLKYYINFKQQGFIDKDIVSEEVSNADIIESILDYYKTVLPSKVPPNHSQMFQYITFIKLHLFDKYDASKMYSNLF